MYRKSEWKSADGNFIVIKKYHAAHALPVNEKNKERRKPKKELTGWRQEEINRKHKRENVQRLLLDNFMPGDWYLTLTYRNSSLPHSESKAKEDLEKFKRNLRTFYSRHGAVCQFISIIEHLYGGGRVHAHIILPALDALLMNDLKKLWPHGNVDIKFYGGTVMDAFNLADYYTKEVVAKTASQVMPSRNLRRTEPRKETVSADTWRDEMKAPEGYEIVTDLSYNYDTIDGYPMQVITLQRINPLYLPRSSPVKNKRRKKKNGTIKKNEKRKKQITAAAEAGQS